MEAVALRIWMSVMSARKMKEKGMLKWDLGWLGHEGLHHLILDYLKRQEACYGSAPKRACRMTGQCIS